LSLIPFVTKWLGETYPASVPTIVYGIIMLMAGLAYSFLQLRIAGQQEHEPLRVAHRRHYRKGSLAVALYSTAIVLAWRGLVAAAIGVYVLIAIAYAMPERGFEAAQE